MNSSNKQQVKIEWTSRYSSTMKNDKMGRWARVAYAGRFDKIFMRSKPVRWEIAWIKKLTDPRTGEWHDKLFVVYPSFPYNGKHTFKTLAAAKRAINSEFNRFIKNCMHKPDIPFEIKGKRDAKKFVRQLAKNVNDAFTGLTAKELAAISSVASGFTGTDEWWVFYGMKQLILDLCENNKPRHKLHRGVKRTKQQKK